MLDKFFRVIFTLIGGLIGLLTYRFIIYLVELQTGAGGIKMPDWQYVFYAVACVILCGLIFFRISPSLSKKTKNVALDIEDNLSSISTNKLIAGILGLIVGLIVAYFIGQLYEGMKLGYVKPILLVLTYLILGTFGAFIASERSKDILTTITPSEKRGGIFLSRKDKETHTSSPKILDTSVIIDGRIKEVMKAGFLEGPYIIPEFVLLELQYIADSSDSLKRVRGRRGLDILKTIQTDYGIGIYDTSNENSIKEIPDVDIKLLKLASLMDGKVVTNDYNLNKVAKIRGVDVLNVNELANVLKPVILPGENMELLLVKEGKERQQAVGYMDDGTMIVVEEGKRFIGKSVKVEVTTVLQTSAGRMIFAKPKYGR